MDTTLYRAIVSKNSARLRQFTSDDLLDAKTDRNNTALHVAVQFRDGSCVEKIYNTCPQLLRRANSSGETALHIAARNGLVNIVKFLIDSDPEDVENGVPRLTRIVNYKKDTALHEAVRSGHYEIVKMLTEVDTDFQYLANDAGETPVYLAAEAGYKNIVEQIINTCQTVAYGGPGGRTALHAAILLNETVIAKLLLDKKSDLIKEKDDKGWTSLHCAAIMEETTMIKNITDRCPESWELLDSSHRNLLHVAVMHWNHKVVDYILKSDLSVEDLLNQPDIEENTPFHLAAYSRSTRIIRLLDRDPRVNKNAINKKKLTVGDTIKQNLHLHESLSFPFLRMAGGSLSRRKQIILREGLGYKDSVYERWMKNLKDGSEMRLVVAALVLTVTFTAGITVPGGFKSEGADQGTALLSLKSEGPHQGSILLFQLLTRNVAFKMFVITNSLAVVFSATALLSHFVAVTESARNDTEEKAYLWEAAVCTRIALVLMLAAFQAGSYAVLSNSLALGFTPLVILALCLTSLLYLREERLCRVLY